MGATERETTLIIDKIETLGDNVKERFEGLAKTFHLRIDKIEEDVIVKQEHIVEMLDKHSAMFEKQEGRICDIEKTLLEEKIETKQRHAMVNRRQKRLSIWLPVVCTILTIATAVAIHSLK